LPITLEQMTGVAHLDGYGARIFSPGPLAGLSAMIDQIRGDRAGRHPGRDGLSQEWRAHANV
jgi:hypothetical protein